MTRMFLLVDDQGWRTTVFENQVAVPDELEFEVFHDPADLSELTADDLVEIDGVIADFHLHTSTRDSYQPLRCAGGQVPVETGMGVLLHLREQDQDMTLYGLIELTHKHAPLFLTAAHSWLGAEPLNVNEEPEIIRQVLLSDGADAHLQASYRQTRDALRPFELLMDSCLTRTPDETYDWLRLYRLTHEPRAHVQLKNDFKRHGFQNKVDPDNVYLPVVRRWLPLLAEFVEAWGGDVSDWPEPDMITTRSLAVRNPVLDYLKNGAYDVFFNAQDVRAALRHFRAVS